MRQRLVKVICMIALSVSVFLCAASVAMAEETEEETVNDVEFVSEITLTGTETDMVSVLSDLPEYFYNGSSSLSTRTTFGFIYWSNQVGNALKQYEARGSYEMNVPIIYRFAVESGHTYNGQIQFPVTFTMRELEPDKYPYQWSTLSLSGMTQESMYDGITVSYYGVTTPDGATTIPSVSFWVVISFNNFQPTFTGDCYVNAMFEIRGSMRLNYTLSSTSTYCPSAILDCSVASDYVGDLFDYPTDAVMDSTGSLITNQTIIQQQIADQQSQQSAQQHDSLINGYDNAANDSMLAEKNSTLQNFEQQQDQAIDSGQQYVADYAAQYDTAVFSGMAPAFALVSTMFNSLWNGMGNFSVVLIVGLMLCVAGYILKLKH